MSNIAEKIEKIFATEYGNHPVLFFSPGRINLIGEHVDYNDGFVLPAAIDKGICYALSRNETNEIRIFAADLNKKLAVKTDAIKKGRGWRNYVLGVIHEFQLKGFNVKGFDCVFGGDIPPGAGMSSSAAVEGGLAFGLNEIFGFGLSRLELALLCQRAEHGFPGVQCGIMDQFANMFGRAGQLILLDCKDHSFCYFTINAPDHEIILLNTRVQHNLAGSEYNKRRKECNKGLEILRSNLGINSFREIKDPGVLDKFKTEMKPKVYNRCRYVIEEIRRTQHAATCLESGDMVSLGKLMFETHDGLRDLYEVSCPELDLLVELAKHSDAVAGARLMGGGFGGCTINLVQREGTDEFVEKAKGEFQKKFGTEIDVYRVKISGGTKWLEG